MKKIIFILYFLFFLTACTNIETNETVSAEKDTAAAALAEAKSNHLGTKWGDEIESKVTSVNLQRTTNSPIDMNTIRYRANKPAASKNINNISLAAGRISLTVQGDYGNFALYRLNGNYFLQGRDNEAYSLHYQNNSSQTFEIVASVDGINVLNGQSASKYDSGYVLKPYSSLTIAGFRKDANSVASFIFTSKKADTYAAHNKNANVQNTGVIGTAIYELKQAKNESSPHFPKTANPFPNDAYEEQGKFAPLPE
ncbi:MAG: membrane lipoprotein lipid attachment site-containing protein [Cardiobacteriaceae bacterium]|nr:membrane lipoprotein lipid attachment site-containing protein [Cardiobacteriaceae bacterium]